MEKEQEVIEEKEVMPTDEEIVGEVAEVKGERAIVELFKKNSKKKSSKRLDVSNPISAKKGYIVKIAWRKVSKTKDNMMLLLPPVLCLVAGTIFSYNMADYMNRRKPVSFEFVMLIGISLWFLLGLFYSFRYWRDTYGRGLQPTIISIIRRG